MDEIIFCVHEINEGGADGVPRARRCSVEQLGGHVFYSHSHIAAHAYLFKPDVFKDFHVVLL
jgi:hypothetical protein